jgi:hypothetical protein
MAPRGRLVVAVLSLALSTACSTTRVVRLDTGQGEPFIHIPRTDEAEPVELGKEEFTKAIAKDVRQKRPPQAPQECGRRASSLQLPLYEQGGC